MRITVTDLLPGGQYALQFRSKNKTETSPWSRTFVVNVGHDLMPPAMPENLAVEVKGDAFISTWDKVTTNDDGSDLTDFSHYIVRIRNVSNNVTVDLQSNDSRYELTFNLNLALFFPVAATIGVQVAAVDLNENVSEFTDEIIVQNPPPNPIRNLRVEPGLESLIINFDKPLDLEDDFLEYRIFITNSATTEIDNMTEAVWAGQGTSYTYHTMSMIPLYTHVVAVDKFNSISEVVTSDAVTPRNSFEVDTEAPSIPTDLAGTITDYDLNLTWTRPVENDLLGYQIGFRRSDSTEWSYATAMHDVEKTTVTPIEQFVDYDVRIRAHDTSFNYSGWSSTVTVQGETNVAPAKVQNVMIRGALSTAMVMWDRVDESDINHYEVQWDDAAPTELTEIYTTSSNIISFSEGVDDETQFYARVRAVDDAGLKGEWSDVATTSIGFPSWVGEWVAETGAELEQKLTDADGNIIDAEARLRGAEDALKDSSGQIVDAGEWIEITGAQLDANLAQAQQDIDAAETRLDAAETRLTTAEGEIADASDWIDVTGAQLGTNLAAAQDALNTAFPSGPFDVDAAIDAIVAGAGGNLITYSNITEANKPGPPPTSTAGRKSGDIHRNRNNSTYEVYAEWMLGANGNWQPVNFGDSILRSLDVGKITGGSAAFEQFVSQNLTSNTAVINDLWTNVVRSQKITTDMLIVGSGPNLVPDPGFQSPQANAFRTGYGPWRLGTYGAGPGGQPMTTNNNSGTADLPLWTAPNEWWAVSSNAEIVFSALVSGPADQLSAYLDVMKADGTQGTRTYRPLTWESAGRVEARWNLPSLESWIGGRVAAVRVAVRRTSGSSSFYSFVSSPRVSVATDSSMIVDGAVTAKKITITGDENNPDEAGLVANIASIMNLDVKNLVSTNATIDVGVVNQLWADVVRSRKITTDMLVVGSGENRIVDPYFDSSELRDLRGAQSNVVGSWGRSSNNDRRYFGGGGQPGASQTFYFITGEGGIGSNAPFTDVAEGDTFRIRYTVDVTGDVRPYFRVKFADGTTSGSALGASWTTYTSGIRDIEYTFTIPAGAVGLIPALHFNLASTIRIYGGASLVRMSDASLIVDGAITAKKITITGDPNNPDETGLVANIASIMNLDVENLTATGTSTLKTAVIENLWTNVVRAKKITADMVLIGRGINLLADPGFLDDDLTQHRIAQSSGNWSLATGGNLPNRVRSDANSSIQSFRFGTAEERYTPIEPGNSYLIRWQARRGAGTARARPAIRYRNQDGSLTYIAGGTYNELTTAMAWYEFVWTAPDSAVAAEFEIQVEAGSTTWTNFTNPLVSVDGASLIVDGSVKARKIDTGDLTADAGFITNLKSAFIATNFIEADMIHAGAGFIDDMVVKKGFQIGDATNLGYIQTHGYDANNGIRIDKNNGIIVNSGSISAKALNINYGSNLMTAAYTDFEMPAWAYPTSVYGGGTATIQEGDAKFGAQSMKFVSTAGGQSYYFFGEGPTDYHTAIEPNETYILSCYVKHVSGAGAEIALRFRYQDGTYSPISSNMPIGTSANWIRVSYVFTADANATAGIPVLYNRVADASTVLIDGLQLERKTGNSSEPSPWAPGVGTTIHGGMIRTGEIRSNQNVTVNGKSQPMWSINMAGNMQIGNALVRGSLVVGSDIGGTDGIHSTIQSFDYAPGSSGWIIRSGGDSEFNSVKIRGSLGIVDIDAGGRIRAGTSTHYTQMNATSFSVYSSSQVAFFAGTNSIYMNRPGTNERVFTINSVGGTFNGQLQAFSDTNTGVRVTPSGQAGTNGVRGIVEFLDGGTQLGRIGAFSVGSLGMYGSGDANVSVTATTASMRGGSIGLESPDISIENLSAGQIELLSNNQPGGSGRGDITLRSGGGFTTGAIPGGDVTIQAGVRRTSANPLQFFNATSHIFLDANEVEVRGGDLRIGADEASTAASALKFRRNAIIESPNASNNLDIKSRGGIYLHNSVPGSGNTWGASPNFLFVGGSSTFQVSGLGDRTTTAAANGFINSEGHFYRSTSVRAAKIDITTLDDWTGIKKLRPVTYYDRSNVEEYAAALDTAHKENTEPDLDNIEQIVKHVGLIAEEVEEVDPLLAMYNQDGSLAGVAYERVGVALIPWLHELEDSNEELRKENADLRGMIEDLAAQVASLTQP